MLLKLQTNMLDCPCLKCAIYHMTKDQLYANSLKYRRYKWNPGMSRPYLCEAHVCTHALATAVHIPHLDLAIQPSRQQQMTSLGEEPAAEVDQVSTTTAESVDWT